jgi:hypothetical protein
VSRYLMPGSVISHAKATEAAPDDALYCPNCGEECETLTVLEDSDPSVGYRGEIEMCAACLQAWEKA